MGKLNNPVQVETELGGRPLYIESGRLAKQANGSVYIKYGETSALVTAVSSNESNPDAPFFPLTIEIQEKFYASGKIPGGFFKREARPTEWATLNARMVDRPLRPLFPEGFKAETQVAITILSYDNENELETIAGLGASAALYVSDIPFATPIATVRVGRKDGNFVLNPSPEEQETCDINVLVSATEEALVMVEGGADFAKDEDFIEALYFGFDKIQDLIKLQKSLGEKIGKTKVDFVPPEKDTVVLEKVKAACWDKLPDAFAVREKLARYAALSAVKKDLLNSMLAESVPEGMSEDSYTKKIKESFDELKKDYARTLTLDSGKRIDGRDYDQVRSIETEVGFLPRVHGSALFTRGETQSLGIVTLGTGDDEQMIDSVRGKFQKKFLLHYNFPPYSVGECGRFGGTSRREIGHGTLAERAVLPIIPKGEDYAYTIRVVSEVLESNGSSSMATVCTSTMGMMDAGVPIKEMVAGIAMGCMKEGEKLVVLSDILGDEDHLGDMDFKVCGNERGVTAVQMDIKMDGVTRELLTKAMKQAKEGRVHILNEMKKTISESREEMSKYAPRFDIFKISEEKIKDLIGPGGKNIKNIINTTGVKVEVTDDGTVKVASTDPLAAEKAIEMIKDLTEEAEVGKIYMGKVVKVADYGAFVEIMSGTSGLCHISELDNSRVRAVEDICKEGDEIPVKVLDVDRQGKIRLSRKAAMSESN